MLSVSILLILYVTYATTNIPPCSLNGVQKQGECHCNPGWTGGNCERLHFVPAANPPEQPLHAYNLSDSTWGMSVVYFEGQYHAYMTEIGNNCSLKYYGTASTVIHLTAPHPSGPWTKRGIALHQFAHNPQAVLASDKKRILLFHIGTPMESECIPNCTGNSGQPLPLPSKCSHHKPAHGSSLAVATSPFGPWKRYPYVVSSVTNPGPYVFPNGTIWVAVRRARGDHVLIVYGHEDTPEGPWKEQQLKFVGNHSIFEEDPFLWQDKNGHFHMLTHKEITNGPTNRTRYCGGGHLYSVDGHTWYQGNGLVYECPTQFQSGAVDLTSRQRPFLHFDENTGTQWLYGGVSTAPDEFDHCWTLIQELAH